MGTGREEGARGRGQIGALHWQMKEIGVYPQEVVHPKIPRVVSLGSRGHVRKRGPSGWSQVILKTGIIVSYPEIRWAVVGGAEGTQMGNKVEGGVKIVRCLTDGGGGGAARVTRWFWAQGMIRSEWWCPSLGQEARCGWRRHGEGTRGCERVCTGCARRRGIFSRHGYCPEISLAHPLN